MSAAGLSSFAPEALAPQLQALADELHAGGGCIEGLRRLSGGASQESWSFDLVQTAGRVPLVLRRAPRGAQPRAGASAGLATEARLLECTAAAGVPVPRFVLLLRPEHGLGEGYVMGRLDGETLGRRIVGDARYAAARPQLARQCGQTLARIHATPQAGLPPLRAAGAAAELEHYRKQHGNFGDARPVFELALRWLQDHVPGGSSASTLVHGDFRNGNLMVGEDGLRGVLDWELAHLGDPMEDLGWICVNAWRYGRRELPVGGFGTREELYAGYESAGGRVDRARAQYWEVLGTLKWGVICEDMAAAFLSGADPTLERGAIGRRTSETDLDLLHLLAPAARSA